jgi:hypothetical protein
MFCFRARRARSSRWSAERLVEGVVEAMAARVFSALCGWWCALRRGWGWFVSFAGWVCVRCG